MDAKRRSACVSPCFYFSIWSTKFFVSLITSAFLLSLTSSTLPPTQTKEFAHDFIGEAEEITKKYINSLKLVRRYQNMNDLTKERIEKNVYHIDLMRQQQQINQAILPNDEYTKDASRSLNDYLIKKQTDTEQRKVLLQKSKSQGLLHSKFLISPQKPERPPKQKYATSMLCWLSMLIGVMGSNHPKAEPHMT